MPDSHLLYAANVAAEFLDPEGTGKPKNDRIRGAFSSNSGMLLGGGLTKEDEDKVCHDIKLFYCYST